MSFSRPVIYISSTVYDFQDLRSALKYWLEQLGYEVLLSEFNDFTKTLEELCRDLLRAMDGDVSHLSNISVRPPTPIESMATEINNERCTVEEISEWARVRG